ncbi:MAG: hypothetical protein HY841_03170 [Bacteroidetes bacterium]|nr:hypothetical protein [Bacteroidota bacterium]
MLRSLIYFAKLALYWLVFFTLYRIIFLISYPSKIPDGKFSEALMVFVYSFRMDAATIAYLIAIPLILWAIQQFVKKNFINRTNHFYNIALISAITIVCISNIAMYGEWNALINYNTFHYLLSPAKIFPYLNTFELIATGLGVMAGIAAFVLLFRVMILMVIPYSTGKMMYKLIIPPIIFPIVFFTMRGGTQQMPINETSACFSETKFLDHVSVNPVWHLGHMAFLGVEEIEKEPLP